MYEKKKKNVVFRDHEVARTGPKVREFGGYDNNMSYGVGRNRICKFDLQKPPQSGNHILRSACRCLPVYTVHGTTSAVSPVAAYRVSVLFFRNRNLSDKNKKITIATKNKK